MDNPADQRSSKREGVIGLRVANAEKLEITEHDVLDLSAGGAFLSGASPGEDQPVRLAGNWRGQSFVIEGTVRWAGDSAAHGSEGFGIEIERLPVALRKVVGE